MSKKIVGIEISDDQLKLVEIARKRKQTVITKFAIESIPTGLIQNGIIQNHEEMLEFLKKIKKQVKLGNRRINLSINSPNILLRPLQMPKLEHKLLAKAIEIEIANSVQLPFQEFTYDYALIPERENEHRLELEEEKQDLMLVLASKEMLESYVNVFSKVKLQVVSIDLAPISFLRLLEFERHAKPIQFFMGINVHEYFAEVSIFNDGVLQLSRNIAFNQQQYLGQAEDQDRLDYEAYNIDLVREVERILNFFRYTLKHREQQLHEIVIAGHLPNETESVAASLSAYFQAPVSILAAQNVRVDNKISRGYSLRQAMLTIPLGLALKEVRA